jgi:hypothetical protein
MQGPQAKIGKDVNFVGPQGYRGPNGPEGPTLPKEMFNDAWRYRAEIAKIQRNHAWRVRESKPGDFRSGWSPFYFEYIPWWKRFYYWLVGK